MSLSNKCFYALLPLALLLSAVVIIYALICSWMVTAEYSPTTRGIRAVDSLKLVIVVSHHGNRRLATFPNDPYPLNNSRLWPYGLGDLTTAGRVQMYNLGSKVRALYNGFLNSIYYKDEFYASSTKLDCVMISGLAFLAGLYPPTDFQVWNRNIDWQPIPIYTDSQDKTVVITEKPCRRLILDQSQSLAQLMLDKDNSFTVLSIAEYLKPLTGDKGSMVVYDAWDTFISEESEGYILPEWVRKVYPEPMNDLMSKLNIALFCGTDTITRIILGSFYQEMIELMASKVNKTMISDRKMYFYSGHDSSLIALQYILGIPKSSIIGVVNPGSAMMFELHQEPGDNRFFVQVLYIDGFSADLEPAVLQVPNCGSKCDFEYLANSTFKFYNNTDYDAECQLNISEKKSHF